MSDLQHLWDELRRSVADPDDMPGPDSFEAQRALAAALTQETREQRRKRWGRVLAIAAIPIGLIAAATIRYLPVEHTFEVGCFEAADLESNRLVSEVDAQPGPEDCAEWWFNGELTNPEVPSGQVPPLVACVTETGVLWVFPSDDPTTCQRLGLADPESPPVGSPDSVIRGALIDRYAWEACVPPQQAADEISEILINLGFPDWSVSYDIAAEGECTTLAIDPNEKVVSVVPVPPKG